ncbi:MAG: metallopeptidase family protein [Chloroflexi bacterium]|nr:metallopeptidase family protein [Chloroflexota bacterium]
MQMPPHEFEQHVLAAYQRLPSSAQTALDDGNIDIVVEDWPGPEAEGAFDPDHGDGTLLGLYVGVPLIDRYGGEPILPDCIYIYRRPILEVCDSYDTVVEEIRITLLHEIGHYLGLGEQDLERLGYA